MRLRRRPPCHGLTVLLFVLALAGATGCGGGTEPPVPRDIAFRGDGVLDFLRPDSTVITRIAIEIADSDSAHARGLMDRRALPDRGGMLFYYDSVEERSFWMRSTPLSLDIMFIGADNSVVNVVERTTPYSDDRINSAGPVRHVLEVRAGFAAVNGIGPGTLVKWRRTQ